MARFISGFAVGFSSVWQLTLVTVAVVPLMALAGGTYAAVTVGLTGKSQKAYAEAGRVALEVNTFSFLHMLISYPDILSNSFLRKLNSFLCTGNTLISQSFYKLLLQTSIMSLLS